MRVVISLSLTVAGALLLAATGCSASAANDASGGTGATSGTAGSGTGGSGGSFNFDAGGTSGSAGKLTSTPPCDQTDPNSDWDGDGFKAGDDCNDCTKQINPGAYDWPGNGVDEDCSGTPDDEHVGCDAAPVEVASDDAELAARVIGICRKAEGTHWGLMSARYVKADGTTGVASVSHGLLPGFGPNVAPREGANLLALSSGTARRPTDPGFLDPQGAQLNTASKTPVGFPIDSPSCTGVKTADDTTARDPAALELVIRTPTNANQITFNFSFYTYEFPSFVCTQYNDFFVALVDPAPKGAQNANVSFDSQGNPVSVNNGYLEVCDPQTAGGKPFACPLGSKQLQGTGFDGHAATGWLQTRAPIPGGYDITIRFAVWDMHDEVLDSTVLVDNFSFDLGDGGPATQPIPK